VQLFFDVKLNEKTSNSHNSSPTPMAARGDVCLAAVPSINLPFLLPLLDPHLKWMASPLMHAALYLSLKNKYGHAQTYARGTSVTPLCRHPGRRSWSQFLFLRDTSLASLFISLSIWHERLIDLCSSFQCKCLPFVSPLDRSRCHSRCSIDCGRCLGEQSVFDFPPLRLWQHARIVFNAFRKGWIQAKQ